MATIIDKQCGVIGNLFLGVVRDTQFLEKEPNLPHGAHDLVMNNLTVNAEAGRDLLNRPHYTYNLGTALALMDCSMTLAATPSFFPELKLEAVKVVHYRDVQPDSFASYEHLKATTPASLKPFTPHAVTDDATRAQLTNVLFDCSARFVALHEQGHFFRGHLHYLFGESANLSFQELPPFGKTATRDPTVVRGLELDADAFAAAVMFGDILDFPDIFDAKKLSLGKFRGAEDYARLAITSVACIFAILARNDARRRPEDKESERDHPSAPCRLLNVWNVFAQAFRRAFGVGPADHHRFLDSCLADVNAVLSLLQGPSLEARHIQVVEQGGAYDLSDAVLAELDTDKTSEDRLKPYLSRFSEAWFQELK